MFRGERLAAAAALALVIPAAASAGPIIFDNEVVPTRGVALSVPDPWTLADDFILAPGFSTIGDVHWSGGFRFGSIAPDTQEFVIRVFADDGGLPSGLALTEQRVTPLRSEVPASSPRFAYSADITPITLPADTVFWLAIAWVPSTMFPPDTWFWLGDELATGDAVYGRPEIGWTRLYPLVAVGDLDFELTEVPEPGSLALLGVALAGVAVRRSSFRRARR